MLFLRLPLTMRTVQQCVTALLALCMLLAVVGIPLPQMSKGKDRSIPFPCMNSPCGCADAESCWKKCCCHTNQEKLAWAKQHNVSPPDYVIAAAKLEQGTTAPACCCQKMLTKTKSCCSPVVKPAVEDVKAEVENAEETSVQIVILEDLNRCQGNASLWLVLSQALPVNAAASRVELPLPLVSWQTPPLSLPAFSPVYAIDTPPPRRA